MDGENFIHGRGRPAGIGASPLGFVAGGGKDEGDAAHCGLAEGDGAENGDGSIFRLSSDDA